MKKFTLLILLLFAMACSSPDSDQPAAARPVTEPKDPHASLAMWEWPARSGEPRDLAADHAACLEKADGASKAMIRAAELWACMRGEGWHRVKERNRLDLRVLRSLWLWGGPQDRKPDLAGDERACNQPPVVEHARPAELTRFWTCMESKGWVRNEALWKQRLSSPR